MLLRYYFAFMILVLILLLQAATNDEFVHWFIIPVFLCGMTAAIDVVNWLSGKFLLFDPAGLLGIFSLHFFFLAPIMHVNAGYWLPYVFTTVDDWRPWVGGMAFLNFVGLIIYRIFRNGNFTQKNATLWELNKKQFLMLAGIALFVSGLLQAYVYFISGGILGYIRLYTESRESFNGMGWIFMLSESFPILALMAYVIWAQDKKWVKKWAVIFLVLVVFFLLKLLFGGLRGSRSNTIWGLIWAVGIIHIWIRPFTKKILILALIPLVLFMYIYGFYKAAGLDGLSAFLQGGTARQAVESQNNRGLETTLLGDLGRTDVQAYLLYQAFHNTSYEYALGRTYVGTLCLLIPSFIWQDRPQTKVKEGTQILYEIESSSYTGSITSSRIYGLAGETLLNYGWAAIPFSFILLGIYVRRIRCLLLKLKQCDARLLVYPFLMTTCLLLLGSDSDNMLFIFIKNGFLPFLVIFLSSNRYKISNRM
ncbi:hypothetical protein [Paenibacillus xerothermodurans]|uniref:O-antigen polysaccharide polymerase Wzy n=1 Tax=Paenibacillus xerothermodurans TaxID=1977292 RepID=A0A2W1NLZ4_PAEXE|nr:hypothetical protein [Paenibacillus xerothermodurans]PZE20475.1 hypothetical protein CBW46_013665 [Paenibacillus xerothermodurans]